jgi:shikimate dehydrogenase
MTDGQTQLVGLIGWPIEHSLSPVMHNAAFEALGLNWHYVPLSVPPGQIATAVHGLGALGFRGANVTVPYKQAVLRLLNTVTPEARTLGAVNTLIIERSDPGTTNVQGDNTDHKGFIAALRDSGFELQRDGNAVVVGAGGAARAIVFGLAWSGFKDILILNRTLQHAQDLVSEVNRRSEYTTRARALPLTAETLIESSRSADLLVHSTTLGMWPHVENTIWPLDVPVPPGLTVFDLVYNPLETALLRHTRLSGAQAIDGLGMLVWQGAFAFELWTRQDSVSEIAPLMRAACEKALKRTEKK